MIFDLVIDEAFDSNYLYTRFRLLWQSNSTLVMRFPHGEIKYSLIKPLLSRLIGQ